MPEPKPSTQHSAVSSQPERTPPPKGYLEVGTNGHGEVVVNHPDLEPDENGVGHIIFSPAEARGLADLLNKKANEAHAEQLAAAEYAAVAYAADENRALRGALEAALEQGCGCTQITANHNHHTATCFVPKAQAALRAAKESAQ